MKNISKETKLLFTFIGIVIAIAAITYFSMNINNYNNDTYAIKINDEFNGRGIHLFKKSFSNDIYLFAGNVDEFYDGIQVESISITGNEVGIDSGYGTIYKSNIATLTVRNTNNGERYNIRGFADSVDDTTPYVSLADVMSIIGYNYNINGITKIINVTK